MRMLCTYEQYMTAPLVSFSYRGNQIDEWPSVTDTEDRFLTQDMLHEADIFNRVSVDDMGVIHAFIKEGISDEFQQYFFDKYKTFCKKYKSQIPSQILDRIENAFINDCNHFMRFNSSDIAMATVQFENLKGINIRITVERV